MKKIKIEVEAELELSEREENIYRQGRIRGFTDAMLVAGITAFIIVIIIEILKKT